MKAFWKEWGEDTGVLRGGNTIAGKYDAPNK